MELSKACIAVSGSVSLELLYRAKPTVTVYGVHPVMTKIMRALMTAKYCTLVNLLADRMIYPEFTGEFLEPTGVARAVLHWLEDEHAYANVCRDLFELRERVARPGACAAAARYILDAMGRCQSLAA
jgi:lipid-A-disaccharide synthase